MNKFTFLLPDKQRDFLAQRAEEHDRSLSYILREILKEKIENLEKDGEDRSENGN